MGEFLYQVMFYNGKGVRFYADGIIEIADKYAFLLNGDTIAEFNKTNIAGYQILGVNEDERE